MVSKINVYFEGWGQRWLWGTLAESPALTGRPVIYFEYGPDAYQRGYELSGYTLPLEGERLRQDFPRHQQGLPSPVYDALPDGWGMLLMDRLFKKRGIEPATVSALDRLAYIGSTAMGAMSFEPVAPEVDEPAPNIPLGQLAQEVHAEMQGEGSEFLRELMLMGGSPHGARPKALIYLDAASGQYSTADGPGRTPWLVKFPAMNEHPEVCALEDLYALMLRQCGIQTPQTQYIPLGAEGAAFATERFDRHQGLRVPTQTLAAFLGADYRVPGSVDYANFLRATGACTKSRPQVFEAYRRAVFNVVFNNRDDHPKNFSYLMDANGDWTLSPAYDVTYCPGPSGYHQMDVSGEALNIKGSDLVALGVKIAGVSEVEALATIKDFSAVAASFGQLASTHYPKEIRRETITAIEARISASFKLLQG